MRRVLLWACTLCCVPTSAWAQEASEQRENTPKSVEQVFADARDAIVVVTFSGRDGNQQGLESGFVISPDGLIATHLHVLGDARPIKDRTADGKRFNRPCFRSQARPRAHSGRRQGFTVPGARGLRFAQRGAGGRLGGQPARIHAQHRLRRRFRKTGHR